VKQSLSHRIEGGLLIDRARPVRFEFDGQGYIGFEGDTLASALLANGVRLLGRSFKYHRPRGVVTAWVDEPNALVQLVGDEDEPNVRATTQPLRDGLAAQSQNRWPSLAFDVGAINDRFHRFFPAGFYYKTLMGGLGWNVYGRIIRRMAGLGTAPVAPPEHQYEKRFHHTDVLVVGAGPAGLATALTLARAGVRVMLVDDAPVPGGQLVDTGDSVNGMAGHLWAQQVASELDECPHVLRLQATTATGYYEHNFLTLLERGDGDTPWHERVWKVRARQVVLCCGAIERPLVFENNDRPGVMQLHAALTYARRYGVLPGRRAVVVANNQAVAPTISDLSELGLDIAALVDIRSSTSAALDVIRLPAGTQHLSAHTLLCVNGENSVRSVSVASLALPDLTKTIDCDLVLMSGGWNPLVHLSSHAGAKPVYEPAVEAFVPGTPVQAERSVGAMRGEFSLAGCLRDGIAGALSVLDELGTAVPDNIPVFETDSQLPLRLEALWRLPGNGKGRAFVDYQNDVTDTDVALAVRENMVSVEHVKRYTTAGMGTDQGKLGNTNTIGLLATALDRAPGDVGTTTYRPPYTPVSFGAITGNDLGELVTPGRRTAITDWIEGAGALMFEAGGSYRRPLCFPRNGEDMPAAIHREVLACRNNVGMYDGSPLGKFELQGRDVVTFLERLYTNRWADLEVGQGRFALMLREDGRLQDDGVTFRLDENRYWMFCGTGAAAHTRMTIERLLSLEWPDLDVFPLWVTTEWTNICVCGPLARQVIEAAGTDIDMSTEALPFMGIRIGTVAGHKARVARAGYTGELSFEVNVPADEGLALWMSLLDAGNAHGITPVGSEASMVMRCEKGFISAGYEGDGTVNPYDAGLGWVVDETKDDFIGKRSLARDRNVGGVRQSVIGLEPFDEKFVPPDGTPIVDGRQADGLPNVVGYVTQGCMSPTLGRSIAMAVMDDGRSRLGETVTLASMTRSGPARIVKPCFFDPTGKRMR
jgi:sarcosine oxidase subunit alpha